MFQFTTIYYRVDDEEKLESFFSSTHLQLAEQLPGLVKSEVRALKGRLPLNHPDIAHVGHPVAVLVVFRRVGGDFDGQGVIPGQSGLG